MRSRNIFLILVLIFLQSMLFGQENVKRLALIIGNSGYKYGGSLKNPVNDANLMGKTLNELGFEVILRTDADLVSMRSAFKDFATRIERYDVALFFYAGHGMQIDGQNYLIPIDAKMDDKYSVEFEAFKVSTVNRIFSTNSEKLNIMILDACRNNPYRSWSRGSGSGFSAVKRQGAGTIIAFATREGETASDGAGNNGLFTEHLVKQMHIPQNITDVFQNTRVSVLQASNKQQVPQEWNMLTGNFYFTGKQKPVRPVLANITTSNKSVPKTSYLGTSKSNFKSGMASFNDPRNNRSYGTIGIEVVSKDGKVVPMVWMSENVNYEINDSYAVPGNSERLYIWNAAINACPDGWHLPSDDEWSLLINHFGGSRTAGISLKSTYGWDKKGWNEDGNGDNKSGFNAKPYGYRNDFGTFSSKGKGGFFWTSSDDDSNNARKRTLYYNDSEVEGSSSSKHSAYSCRCVLD